MIRTIKITGRTGRFDVPSFLLTDNEWLTLVFAFDERRTGRYVVSLRHGNQKKTVYLGDEKTVELSPDWLKAGGTAPLEIDLELRTKDATLVRIHSAKSAEDKDGFFIEPLLITETDGAFATYGLLSKIEAEVQDLKTRMKTAEGKLSDFEDEGVPLIPEEESETQNAEIL